MTEAVTQFSRLAHWTPSEKLRLLQAIQNGEISFPEAREKHRLSARELAAWWRSYQIGGIKALRATQPPIGRPDLPPPRPRREPLR